MPWRAAAFERGRRVLLEHSNERWGRGAPDRQEEATEEWPDFKVAKRFGFPQQLELPMPMPHREAAN
jgi:hypothetical protein